MAYTVGSAKDAQGNEQQFVDLATANAQKIYAYKAAHGGDFEGAFKAVTGIPWPEGRSLKMKNFQAEMTKDRTVKSVLGKYVAPIAAAVAAPYLLPALGVGGGTAAGSYIGADVAGTAGAALGGGGALAGGVAAAKAPSLLHSLLPTIIGSGAAVAGTAIAAHGDSAAAKAQAEAADKALAFTKDQYALQRQDTAPYRALGQGAVGNLGYLGGIDVDSKVPELSGTVPKHPYGTDDAHPAPYVVPGARGADGRQFPGAGQPDPYASGQSLSQLSSPQQGVQAPQGGMVRVQSPSGSIGLVPQASLQQALQAGGVQV